MIEYDKDFLQKKGKVRLLYFCIRIRKNKDD